MCIYIYSWKSIHISIRSGGNQYSLISSTANDMLLIVKITVIRFSHFNRVYQPANSISFQEEGGLPHPPLGPDSLAYAHAQHIYV